MSPSSPAGSSSSTLPDSNTLLALPDGSIPPNHPDRTSHTVSYIGGYPSFPPLPSAAKAPEVLKCGVCHEPILLLAQVYCPPEGGENDRTVYVWACVKVGCQRREGSIRALRASVKNEEYVRDVQEKKRLADELGAKERAKARINPFSMSEQPNGSTLFGSQPLFGASQSLSSPSNTTQPAPPDLASLSISTTTAFKPPLPAFQPPQYLSTIDEYLPPPADIEMESDDDDDDPAQKAEFAEEGWEKLLPKHVDEVFERFKRRLEGAEGGYRQVLRYELGGIPLPYSSTSSLYRQLYPGAPTSFKPSEEAEADTDLSTFYSPSSVPPCPRCRSRRVFELQLVPALISVLRPESISTTGEENAIKNVKLMSEEERKRELARLAGGVSGQDEVGEMEWGTVMVFGCEGDCSGFGEEWVGVEWEGTLEG